MLPELKDPKHIIKFSLPLRKVGLTILKLWTVSEKKNCIIIVRRSTRYQIINHSIFRFHFDNWVILKPASFHWITSAGILICLFATRRTRVATRESCNTVEGLREPIN